MENFTLFNLFRALGGIFADGNAADGADGETNSDNIRPAGGANFAGAGIRQGGTTAAPKGGQQGNAQSPYAAAGQANVLAAVLERHEKISNRIKSKPPDGR